MQFPGKGMDVVQANTSDVHWCLLMDILNNFSLQFLPFHPHYLCLSSPCPVLRLHFIYLHTGSNQATILGPVLKEGSALALSQLDPSHRARSPWNQGTSAQAPET